MKPIMIKYQFLSSPIGQRIRADVTLIPPMHEYIQAILLHHWTAGLRDTAPCRTWFIAFRTG